MPEYGGGGGEVILAMPERNQFLSCEVFPYSFKWLATFASWCKRKPNGMQVAIKECPFKSKLCM